VLFIPFLPVGPTWDGPLGPIFPFWLFLDLVLRGEITKRSFGGWRYSVSGHEGLYGWMILSCWSDWLHHGFGLSWGGMPSLLGKRLSRGSLEGRRLLGGSLEAAYFGRFSFVIYAATGFAEGHVLGRVFGMVCAATGTIVE